MLLEQIHHHNHLHFSTAFSNVAQEAPHYHKEMELVLVLRGSACYKVHHQEFLVEAGEICVVDTEDLHYIHHSSPDVIMLQCHVDMSHFKDRYPNIDVMYFICEMEKDSANRQHGIHNKIAFLSHHIAEMMMLTHQADSDALLSKKLDEFIYIMVDQFQSLFIDDREFHHGKHDTNPLDLERLYRIMHYMYRNYDKKISLRQVAELEHLNMHYVSHLIKKTSGLSFQNLLNYIRVEKAEKHLNENKLTLTQISEFCGFSSLAYFNKCFSIWHDVTPAQYRKQPKPEQRTWHGDLDEVKAMELLQPYLDTDIAAASPKKGGYSTQHLFIPIGSQQEGNREVKKAFPLRIRIQTKEDLIRLGYFSQQIIELSPASIHISQHLISSDEYTTLLVQDLYKLGIPVMETEETNDDHICRIPAFTPADAFASLTKHPDQWMKLFDNECGLLTEAGLPTHYYSFYRELAQSHGIVSTHPSQYLELRDKRLKTIVVGHNKKDFSLSVHLQFNGNTLPPYILRKTMAPDHRINRLFSGYEPIHPKISKQLFLMSDGKTDLMEIEQTPGKPVELTVAPGHLVILMFP